MKVASTVTILTGVPLAYLHRITDNRTGVRGLSQSMRTQESRLFRERHLFFLPQLGTKITGEEIACTPIVEIGRYCCATRFLNSAKSARNIIWQLLCGAFLLSPLTVQEGNDTASDYKVPIPKYNPHSLVEDFELKPRVRTPYLLTLKCLLKRNKFTYSIVGSYRAIVLNSGYGAETKTT